LSQRRVHPASRFLTLSEHFDRVLPHCGGGRRDWMRHVIAPGEGSTDSRKRSNSSSAILCRSASMVTLRYIDEPGPSVSAG
jgi:hypothetical protein